MVVIELRTPLYSYVFHARYMTTMVASVALSSLRHYKLVTVVVSFFSLQKPPVDWQHHLPCNLARCGKSSRQYGDL